MTQISFKKILIYVVIGIAEFAVFPSQAQYYKRGPSKTIVALTFGVGTRSSLIKSDLEYINKMKPTLQGWESSLMLGGRMVRVRTGVGSFKTTLSDVNTIKQTSINGLTNIYVSGLIKHFRPYVITGIDVNIFVFSGPYLPAVGMPPPHPKPGETDNTLQSEEEPASTTPEINSGKMTSTQLIGGLGSEYNFRINGRFVSMFGEMRYGLPIEMTAQSVSMNETRVKNTVALAFGAAMGINKKRKVHRSNIR